MTTDQILSDLDVIVRETFPDREFADDVSSHTRFFEDLGMASIDAIVLAEQIERHYGRKLPFNTFLGGLRQRGATDFDLGELVDFLAEELAR
jgi:acyl carrier protein